MSRTSRIDAAALVRQTLDWMRDRGLTLLLLAMFLLFLVGQVISGFAEYNLSGMAAGYRDSTSIRSASPGDRLDGLAREVFATALVAGVETRACTPLGDWTVSRTQALLFADWRASTCVGLAHLAATL